MSKLPISVIILTLNEEFVIERCLRRVIDWAGEVLVVDSGSTDRTREIAVGLGARVIEQPWLGWVGQRHAGMDAATYDWCFVLESDEVPDDTLLYSISAHFAVMPNPENGFSLVRTEEFCGKLLPETRRRSKQDNFVRLMNRHCSRYDATQIIHEEVIVRGQVIPLDGQLLHWRNFKLDQRFAQDNKNATLEARTMQMSGKRVSMLRAMAMPVLRFLWLYVWCGLWRLGKHGLFYSLSCACREIMREAKLWEAYEIQPLPHPPVHTYTADGSQTSRRSIGKTDLAEGRSA